MTIIELWPSPVLGPTRGEHVGIPPGILDRGRSRGGGHRRRPHGLAAHAPGCRHFRARAAARRRGPGDVRSRITRTHRTQDEKKRSADEQGHVEGRRRHRLRARTIPRSAWNGGKSARARNDVPGRLHRGPRRCDGLGVSSRWSRAQPTTRSSRRPAPCWGQAQLRRGQERRRQRKRGT